MAAPYQTWAAYWAEMESRAITARAASSADKAATGAKAETNSDIQHETDELIAVLNATGAGTFAKDALITGLTFAAAGAGIGSTIVPPIGTVCGAAVGAVVGAFVGFFGDVGKRWDFLSTWEKLLATLTPVERYLLVGGFRDISDRGAIEMSHAKWPSWRICGDGGTFGFTILGGPDALMVFMLESLLKTDWCPAPSAPDSKRALYAQAAICCYHEDDKKLRDMRFISGLMDSHDGSPWLRDWFHQHRDETCGQQRARALAAGLADIKSPPIEGDLQAAIESRNAQVQQMVAQQAGR